MSNIRGFVRKNQKLLSVLGTALAAALILWTVNNPAIVGASATERQLPIYCVQREDRKIAISFDAAWGNEDTQKLIDILKLYDEFYKGGNEAIDAFLAKCHAGDFHGAYEAMLSMKKIQKP